MASNNLPQRQTQLAVPAAGSALRSQTRTPVQSAPSQTETIQPAAPVQAILRLRGAHPPSGQRVQWDENVVDNEGLGRKSSKVCCIYHAPHGVDESSDESSSSSSSDSDSDSEGGGGGRSLSPRSRAKAARRKRENEHDHDHDGHNHDHDHDHGRGSPRAEGSGSGSSRRRRPSPNAYEKQPKPKPRSEPGSGDAGVKRSS